MADEPFVPELDERRPALLDLFVRDRPVDLVEVDRVDPEPREASFELSPQGVALQALQGRAVRPFGLAALGEDERPRSGIARDGPADDLLGVAEAVLRSRIDPVDA